MPETMFLEVLQSYYAPAVTLLIFVVILYTDQLFSKYIRRLFLAETFIIAIIIMATGADRCLSTMDLDGMAWKLRTVTTFTNFILSPLSPMILGLIYNKNGEIKIYPVYFIPAVINALLCIASIFNGWVFYIHPNNVYTRGTLFIVPFLVSGFYLILMLFFTMRQRKRPSRKVETFFLILIIIEIAAATILEVALVIRFMIWSTTEITVILYFLILTTQKILYDPLTGTYSKVAYTKKLERIKEKSGCTIAMIDMNDLKHINDKYGHSEGDKAIIKITTSILKAKSKSMFFYRYGGDEFVLLDKPGMTEKMISVLKAAQDSCGRVAGENISFAFGIAECKEGDDFQECLNMADHAMYKQKNQMKD